MRPLFALFLLTLSLSCAHAATFEVGTISGWPAIRMSGQIVLGDDNTFESLISDKKNLIVELNSPGGAIVPALAIGRLIRDRGNWTLVGSGESCASACAMIWLGGKTRFAHPKGSVGFHAVFDGTTNEITANGNAIVGAYYNYLGLNQDAIFWMASAPPNGMFWLNHDLAVQYNIAYTPATDENRIVVTEQPVASVGIPVNPNAPNVAFVPPTRDAVQDIAPPRQTAAVVPPAEAPMVEHHVNLNPMQEEASLRLSRQFTRRLAMAGPQGLIDSIQACYAAVRANYDVNAAEYCAALDEMTWKLDDRQAAQEGRNTTPFNRPENVRGRVRQMAITIGDEPNSLLDNATEIAKHAQAIIDANPAPVVVDVRPRVVRPRFVRRPAGCANDLAALNPIGALLFGVTPNPACR